MRSTAQLLTVLVALLAVPEYALAQPAGAKKDPAGAKKDPAPTEETAPGTGDLDGKGLAAASKVEPPHEKWDIYDVDEVPGRTYMFVGLRYRGNVVPSFMLHLFVEEGKTVYTNMIGVEFDLRKDGFSIVPALSYHELGTGDILFKEKNSPDIPGNYSLVNSGMKLLYASVDLLWSAKISKNVEFEYGAGFGVGAVFGDLENSWVQEGGGPGSLQGANGKRYVRCNAVQNPANGNGCNKAEHQNSEVDKVNGYKEDSWFSGGSKPALFPWIAIPQFGLRIKPIKNFVGRIGIGFALTGFWFGLNGEYGLEKKRD